MRIATSKHLVTLTGGIQIHPELNHFSKYISETMKSGLHATSMGDSAPVWETLSSHQTGTSTPELAEMGQHESGSLLIATGTSVCFLAEGIY